MIIKHDRHTAVMHVSATKMSQNYTVEDARRSHLKRGWSDIGYHFYIDKNGGLFMGRPIDRNGAHVKGFNNGTIGICCEGGIGEDGKPADTMTASQKFTVEALLLALKKGNPALKVKGHRDYSPDLNGNGKVDSWERLKECPCYDAAERFAMFNGRLEDITLGTGEMRISV